MYGGKNTRPGGEEINKELFKSDWAKEGGDYEFAGDDEFKRRHDTALAIVEESEDEEEAKPSESFYAPPAKRDVFRRRL
jgi:hypothetical protein